MLCCWRIFINEFLSHFIKNLLKHAKTHSENLWRGFNELFTKFMSFHKHFEIIEGDEQSRDPTTCKYFKFLHGFVLKNHQTNICKLFNSLWISSCLVQLIHAVYLDTRHIFSKFVSTFLLVDLKEMNVSSTDLFECTDNYALCLLITVLNCGLTDCYGFQIRIQSHNDRRC